LKILFISNLYPPNAVGGYERLCFSVASDFAARGHDVVVLTSNYGSAREEFAGQRVHRLLELAVGEGGIYEPDQCSPEQRFERDTKNLKLCKEVALESAPDVIFVWNLYFLNQSLLQGISGLGIKTFYLLTDNWLIAFLQPDFIQSYFRKQVYQVAGKKQIRLAGLIDQFSYLRAPKIKISGAAIFPSKFMRRLYKQAGFCFDREAIIHHGVERTSRELQIDRAKLVCQGEVRLLFAGRIVELKGVHTAIAAHASLVRELPEMRITLTIVGDQQDQSYVKQLRSSIQAYQLTELVHFCPPVPEESLSELFDSHDIYLFPSLYEPFALTLIHALAGNIPTIASDAGGNPEIVRHRKTGMLFSKGDSRGMVKCVKQLISNNKLRAEVAARGSRAAQMLTFDKMAHEILSCIES
jgi:glycogen synthase